MLTWRRTVDCFPLLSSLVLSRNEADQCISATLVKAHRNICPSARYVGTESAERSSSSSADYASSESKFSLGVRKSIERNKSQGGIVIGIAQSLKPPFRDSAMQTRQSNWLTWWRWALNTRALPLKCTKICCRGWGLAWTSRDALWNAV